MQALKIIGLCVVLSIAYGIVHDLVTAHVCLEYFTIGHPRLFSSNAPVLHALAWGVIATWWVGLIEGVLLAIAARAGSWPTLVARDLRRPLLIMLLIVGILAAIAGIVGYVLASRGSITLVDIPSNPVPAKAHVRFIANSFAHTTSYLGGAIGGIVLIVLILRRRFVAARRVIGNSLPQS